MMDVSKKMGKNPYISKKALAEHFNVPESTDTRLHELDYTDETKCDQRHTMPVDD